MSKNDSCCCTCQDRLNDCAYGACDIVLSGVIIAKSDCTLKCGECPDYKPEGGKIVNGKADPD